MKLFPIPKNPNEGSPERRRALVERWTTSVGGVVLTAASVYLQRHISYYDIRHEWLTLTTIMGGVMAGLPVATELQERYGNAGGEEDNGRGGGGWDPDDDPAPIIPKSPSGIVPDWTREVEAYANAGRVEQQELIAV